MLLYQIWKCRTQNWKSKDVLSLVCLTRTLTSSLWDLNEIVEGKLGFSLILYSILINGGGWPSGLFGVFLLLSSFLNGRGRWQMKQCSVNMFVDSLKK